MKELLSYKRGIQAHFEQEAPFLRSSFNIIPGSKPKRQYVINNKLPNNVIIVKIIGQCNFLNSRFSYSAINL